MNHQACHYRTEGSSALKKDSAQYRQACIIEFDSYKTSQHFATQHSLPLKERVMNSLKNDPIFSDLWAEPRPETKIAQDTSALLLGIGITFIASILSLFFVL